MEDFHRQEEAGQGSYSNKELIITGKVTFLLGDDKSVSGGLPNWC